MQPTDARRLLPCFDEPDMKAHFHLTIIHPIGTIAIANTHATIRESSQIEFDIIDK